MNIGARIIKTGVSVTLAMIVANLLKLEPAVLAAIAAVIAIQPSVMRSWRYIKEVMLGNVIGLIFATVGYYLFGTGPIYIGIIVILTISVNFKIGLRRSINLAVLTVIAILTSDLHGSTFNTAFNRFSLVGLGAISSFLVNVLLFPPKHDERLYKTLDKLNKKLHTLLRVVPQKEIAITAYKEEISSIDKLFGKAKELFELLDEEKKKIWVVDRHLYLRKVVIIRQMIKVAKKEIALVENIEKHLYTIENFSKNETEEVKDTLNELLHYQELIFLRYENKITSISGKQDKERKYKVENKVKSTVNNLMKHYNSNDNSLWLRLFPVITYLLETEIELKKLNSMVTNYKIRENRKKKKKRKIKGLKETIQNIEQ